MVPEVRNENNKKLIEEFCGPRQVWEGDESYNHSIISDQEDLISGPVTCINSMTADFSLMVERQDAFLVSVS